MYSNTCGTITVNELVVLQTFEFVDDPSDRSNVNSGRQPTFTGLVDERYLQFLVTGLDTTKSGFVKER